MPRFLDEIVAWHRARADADERDLDELFARAVRATAKDPPRDFIASLRRAPGIAVIAEIKRRSPSKGDLAAGLDPSSLASAYASGGAACLSVLTDEPFFGGSAADLGAARTAVTLPVLRKDFTVCRADVADARIMGADAVLLIVAALSDDELRAFLSDARALALSALVEVHDEREAERALAAGASLVGVNHRDLRTFEIDASRAARVAQVLGSGVVKVAESGIRGAADVAPLLDAGIDAVLVGEALVTAPDPAGAVRSLAALQASGAH